MMMLTWMLWGRCRCHAIRIPFWYHMDHIVDPVFRGILGEILRVRGTIYFTAITTARSAKKNFYLVLFRRIIYSLLFILRRIKFISFYLYCLPRVISSHYILRVKINDISLFLFDRAYFRISGLITETKIETLWKEVVHIYVVGRSTTVWKKNTLAAIRGDEIWKSRPSRWVFLLNDQEMISDIPWDRLAPR